MSFPIYTFGHSDVGQERTRNEDAFDCLQLPDGWLLIVCDGMGGHGGGDIASQVAVRVIREHLVQAPEDSIDAAMHSALSAAHVVVLEEAQAAGIPQAGTTAVVVRVFGNRAWVGWIGDSRFYRLRRDGVESMSDDHTRVNEMLQRGIITPEEAVNHPDAHVLSRALGGGDSTPARPSVWNEPLHLEHGDVLLLCSDGLYDLVGDHELLHIAGGGTPEEAVSRLIQTANARGGHDNITVVTSVVGQERLPQPELDLSPRQTLEETVPELPRTQPPPAVAAAPTPASPASAGPEAPLAGPTRHAEPAERKLPVLMLAGLGAAGLVVGLVLGFLLGQVVPDQAPFLKLQGQIEASSEEEVAEDDEEESQDEESQEEEESEDEETQEDAEDAVGVEVPDPAEVQVPPPESPAVKRKKRATKDRP